jgi:phage-related protein
VAQRTLELILKVAVQSSNELERLKQELLNLSNVPLDKIDDGLKSVGDAAGQSEGKVGKFRGGLDAIGGLTGKIAGIGAAFFGIQAAIQGAISASTAFYTATIGANEQLNSQLLSSQTNLASATRIFKDGVEITDPTAKIKASRESLEAALKQIEKDTQNLVGVTSADVNQLFQITLQNAALLNNQAGKLDKSLNSPIKAATQLTKGWAASLKVIGVPLDQAGQEINSILKGTVDQNSILAKNLNITNAQVNQWKAQGKLVEELDKRLQTFVAGNAIAANSIEGISSNIKDFFQIFARELGKPFLQPTINALNGVFQALNANKDSILGFITQLGTQAIAVVQQVAGVIGQVAMGIAQPFINQFEAIKGALQGYFAGIGQGLSSAFAGMAPAIDAVKNTFAAFSQLVANFIVNYAATLGQVLGSIANAFGSVFSAAVVIAGAALRGLIGLFDALINNPITAFLLNTLGQAFALLGNAIAAVLNPLTMLFEGLVNVVGGVLGPIMNLFGSMVGAIVPAQGAFAALGQAFGAIGQALKPATDAFGSLMGVLGVFAQAIGQAIGPPIQMLFSILVAGAQKIGGFVASAFKKLFSDMTPIPPMLGVVAVGFQAVGKVAGAVATAFQSAGKVIGEKIQWVTDQIKGLVNNPAFQAFAKAIGVDVDQLRKSLDDLNKKQAETGDAATEAAKKQAEAAKGGKGELEIKAQNLRKLGTSYEQLAEQAANAQRSIAEQGGGDSKQMEDSVKQLMEVTQQQLELGQITDAEAQKRLEAIANNSVVAVDSQQKAQEQLSKIRQDALQDQTADIDAEIKAVEAGVNAKEIDEVEGAKRIGALKKQQIDAQLKDVKDAITAETAAIKAGRGSKEKLEDLTRKQTTLEADKKNTDTSTAEAQAKAETDARKEQLDIQKANIAAQQAEVEALVAGGQLSDVEGAKQVTALKKQELELQLADIAAQIEAAKKLKDDDKVQLLQAQQSKARADLQKAEVDGRKRIQDAQFKEIEKQEKRTTDLVKTAEAERKAAIDVMVAQGLMDREQAENQKLALTQNSLKKELAAERTSLASLSAISGPEAQEKQLASRRRIAELTSQIAKNEIEQQVRLIDQAAKVIQNRFTAASQSLQPALNVLDAMGKALDNQAKLLSARKDLMKSTNDLIQSQYAIAAELVESAVDENATEAEKKEAAEEARKLKLEAKDAEIAALQQSLALELESFDFEQQKTRLLLQQEQIRLRIQRIEAAANTAKAQAELQKIIAQRGSPAEIQAAQLTLQASQVKESGLGQQEALLGQQAQQGEAIFAMQSRSLARQQDVQILRLQADRAKLTEDKEDDRIVRDQAISFARGNRTAAAQPVQLGLPAMEIPALPPSVGSVMQPPRATGAIAQSPMGQQAEALKQLNDGIAGLKSGVGNSPIQPTFNNFFDGNKPTQAAKTVEKQFLGVLDRVVNQAGQKLKGGN